MTNLNTYLGVDKTSDRLVAEVHKYGSICVAFDFDNTLFDTHGSGLKHIPFTLELFKACTVSQYTDVVIWTVSPVSRYPEIQEYLAQLGISPNQYTINEVLPKYDIVKDSRKPFFSLLLDDRSGLQFTSRILTLTLGKLGEI